MIVAISASSSLGELLAGPPQRALGLGAGHLLVGEQVVSLTRPGAARMPNGLECERLVARGETVWVGAEVVLVETWWNPRPVPNVTLMATGERPSVAALAGRGGGLTPSGDDILCGFAAGLVLFGGRSAEALAIAGSAGPRTTRLSATLLNCAARGELPSPAHDLLERGDRAPLEAFGHSSGRALLVGLALAGRECA